MSIVEFRYPICGIFDVGIVFKVILKQSCINTFKFPWNIAMQWTVKHIAWNGFSTTTISGNKWNYKKNGASNSFDYMKRLRYLSYIYFESRKLVFGRHKICISQWPNVHLKAFIESYWCTSIHGSVWSDERWIKQLYTRNWECVSIENVWLVLPLATIESNISTSKTFCKYIQLPRNYPQQDVSIC